MSARYSFRALFGALDEAAEAELDRRLDAHRAEVLAEDGQAYDGELGLLRGLARTLRSAARKDDGLAEVRRLLDEHARIDGQARSGEKATPDFFQPGHAYTHRNGTDFRCVAVTTHPQSGERLAMGWHIDSWGLHYPTTVGINQWRHEYDGVQAPTDTTQGDSK